jgi:hypothetical protein
MRQALRRLQQQQAARPQCLLLAWLLVAWQLLVLAAARVKLQVITTQ